MTSIGTKARDRLWPGLACVAAGVLIFQFLGNSTRGYIGTSSLFYWWGFQWVDPGSETQHGFLILGISIWLVWRNLRLQPERAMAWAGIRPAVFAMIAGLAIHVLGFVCEQARVSIIGLLLFAWGAIAFLGGQRWARASAFPVIFMVFAIPLNALDSAGFWLRMWVVDCSSRIAHGVGIGVLVNGTQLLSPDGSYNYDVAAACSGIRSLMALSALSLLVGYLEFKSRLLWAVMLAISFPLIFAGNVFRIVSIIVAAHWGGQLWGDRVHEVMGFGVFAIVLGGTFGIAALMGRACPFLRRHDLGPSPEGSRSAFAFDLDGPPSRMRMAAFAVVSASVLAAVLLIHVSRRPASAQTGITLAADGINPVNLPAFLGADWIGRATEVSAFERKVLPPDTGFSRRIYVSLDDPAKQVFLSIVLSGRDRTSIHRPELCLVGQGWTIHGSFYHRFTYPGTSHGFPATILRVEKEISTPAGRKIVPQLFAYYFVGAETVVATHWERIRRDAWDRLAHGRSDRWAYVVAQTGDTDGEQAALARIQTILDGTLPAFQKRG